LAPPGGLVAVDVVAGAFGDVVDMPPDVVAGPGGGFILDIGITIPQAGFYQYYTHHKKNIIARRADIDSKVAYQ